MRLRLLPDRYAICRLAPDADVDLPRGWFSMTRTAEELSLVCEEAVAPACDRREEGWLILQVEGPLDFALTGVLSSLAATLAEAGISIFAVSTFDTDYVLVRDTVLTATLDVLTRAGHAITV